MSAEVVLRESDVQETKETIVMEAAICRMGNRPTNPGKWETDLLPLLTTGTGVSERSTGKNQYWQ